jgi:hypothetical protein
MIQDMSMKVTPFGNSKPRTFVAKSVVRPHHSSSGYVGDYVMLEMPIAIRREYTKGIDSGSLNLKVFGMVAPSIKLGEVGRAQGGHKYRITTEPVKYYDNSGTYSWRSACKVEPLDGGVMPERCEFLIGSGFYQWKDGKDTRLCDQKDDLSGLQILLIGLTLVLIIIYLG